VASPAVAVWIAGELEHGPADNAMLEELLAPIKGELVKLGRIIDLEVACGPRGREFRQQTIGNSTPTHTTLAFIVPTQSLGQLKIAVTLIRFPPIITPLTVH
jgi:hypothetical protein